MNKKTWLDKLYYGIGKQQYDFLLCGIRILPNGERRSTKWKPYSKICFPIDIEEDYRIKYINQRQILPIELVLDLEEESQLTPVVQKLKTFDYTFYIFSTGSRGYHIHVFFNEELTAEQKFYMIKYFGADEQLSSKKHMVALEHTPHWKSGKIKKEVEI